VCTFLDCYPLQRWIELDEGVIDRSILRVAFKTGLGPDWTARSDRQSVSRIEGKEAPFFGKSPFIFHKSGDSTKIGLEVPGAIRADIRPRRPFLEHENRLVGPGPCV